MDSEESERNVIGDKDCQDGYCNSDESICSTIRLQRNQAEKQRRDKLNGYISELANLVPMVKNSSKPVDKVSVLRLAAAHMRLNLSCLNPKNFKSKIPTLPSSIISYLELMEKSVGGFVIVTTFTGTVLFCSKCIEDYIGYQSINIMGQSIYNFINSKEIAFFEKKISSAILRSKKEKNSTKVIKLHLQQRPLPRSTEVKYRKMIFKLSVHYNGTDNQLSNSKSSQRSKKVKHKDFGISSVILMFIEPMKMQPKINRTFLLTHPDIYFTIHGLQGEIMYADQRIATITGYMPREVQGMSAYKYILDTDVPIALFAQKAMFTSNDGSGLITYRLRIIDSTYIYLQSKGQIVYKENTTEMSHFICLNRWLSEEEGKRELIKFQERFAPQISDSKTKDGQEKKLNISPSSNSAEQSSENTLSYSANSNEPYSVEQVSSLPYSENALLIHEYFVKSNHLENSPNSSATLNISSTQSINDFSNFKDEGHVLSGESFENNILKCSLPNSNISSELGFFGEIQQTTYQSESTTYLSEPCLVENQLSTLQTSASSFNQHCIADWPQMLNESKSFNGINMNKEGFSVTPQDFNQCMNQEFSRSANVSQFNLRETSLDFNCENFQSNLNAIYPTDKTLPFPEAPNNNSFSESKVSMFMQPYSSIQKPINSFCWRKDTLLNTDSISVKEFNNLKTDCNLSQKADTSKLNDGKPANSDKISVNKISSFTQSNSSLNKPLHVFCPSKDKLMNRVILNADELTNMDTSMKPIVKEESAVYSNGFYSNKSATSRFEYNGLCNVNPSCTIPDTCLSHKFYSNDTNFDTFNGASYLNGANFGTSNVHEHCEATFGTSHVSSSNSYSTDFSISYDLTNGGRYFTNNINVSNKGFVTINRNNHSKVHGLQKSIGSKNISASSVNFSSPNSLHANPTKRIRTETISRSTENVISDVHQMPTLLKRNDCLDLFSDIVLDNALDQSKASLSVVTETPTQRDSGNSSINGELFNELDRFFKKCPFPLSTQTLVTDESVLSTDLHNKPQLNVSPISAELVLD